MKVDLCAAVCVFVLVSIGTAGMAWGMPQSRPGDRAPGYGPPHARTEGQVVVDAGTGARLRVVSTADGSVWLDMQAGPVAAVKHAWPNGDFDATVRHGDDQFEIVRRGAVLRVARAGLAYDLDLAAPDSLDLAKVRRLASDSVALRQFRAVRQVLSPGALRHRAGAGVAVLDILIGILSGDMPVARPTAATLAADESGMADEGELAGPGCYESYVNEVVLAWDDYVACISQFAWYNPMREVCAFAWVLRAESAWFQFLGCSSIPIKKDSTDAAIPVPAC